MFGSKSFSAECLTRTACVYHPMCGETGALSILIRWRFFFRIIHKRRSTLLRSRAGLQVTDKKLFRPQLLHKVVQLRAACLTFPMPVKRLHLHVHIFLHKSKCRLLGAFLLHNVAHRLIAVIAHVFALGIPSLD